MQDTPQPQQPAYPIMTINPAPHGVVITILHAPFMKEDIVIPAPNADAMAIAWLSQRPPDVLRQINAAIKRAQQEREDIQRAVLHPLCAPVPGGRQA